MTDVKALQQERISIFYDVYDNKIPKRVPVNLSIPFEALAEFGGINIVEAQWNPMIAEGALDKLCQTIYTDVCPGGSSLRYPSYYQALESQSFVMGSNGFFQHPEVVGMLPEEYDYLIEKPYDCLLEKVIPRQYKALNLEDPVNMAISFAKSILGYNNDMMLGGTLMGKMIEKYGYYPGGPIASGGFTEAPFDFLADQLRSFKGVSMDVRRMPEKVAAACEALYPIVLKKGMPKVVSNYSQVFLPLHMPTFMREKDFEKLWWPSFKKLLEEYASMGIHCRIFCEDNWDRYLDYLYDLPTDTVLQFEYGTPKLIKEKLGKKHIITGLFPLTYLKTHTKEECVNLAKEYIDILAPGGKYIFMLDKNPLSINDVNMENLIAVAETVRDYGVYSNAGETAGMQFNKEDYKATPSRPLESKYFKTWDQYKAANPEVSDFGQEKLQGFEERIFQYLMFLLL
ncbi:uroporphyrinogen decarboxylase family protein [Geosporobacter ferrireducens]|uniref:Uroporphyrinogen decarboxylase n=1 Tax=Geosporobacter ferrireducens TaxID=1424294 RepID=A0A1D8GJB0_9FIRM|nr:uroporphyrinogen decarboxylase family protein [Geosporobacter ferrireducens]AOT71001.1 uroporphyrinogen decarboxylase [Geosporobacter ferrireducens]MTI53719.1 uroporphyrinogen decarboxylase [Geosporobacter ferrireducens]